MKNDPAKRHAVRPRDAASLIVFRNVHNAVEVLMGMRAAGHRFMPNRLVFPGGAVERRDYTAPAAAELPPVTAAMLGKAARPRLARALAVAAARELLEEAGLSLGWPPALDGLFYLCRAITPPQLPIRFHARFFVTSADRLEGSLGGSGELEGLRYCPVDETVRSDLSPITQRVLVELQSWLGLADAERRGVRPTACFRGAARYEE